MLILEIAAGVLLGLWLFSTIPVWLHAWREARDYRCDCRQWRRDDKARAKVLKARAKRLNREQFWQQMEAAQAAIMARR
jgi:hypothetical protein